ncbi:adhesion G-protein coupled receptor G7 [Labeo rohita]|uniref:adhesion G-protein coupled receptor G7 n=1 Tax=Labeo rohita TaxID=84645 RepID=UPI0021E2BBED|nr:adhesion G-protein coupled receptor G7 [Labeo rohita]
MAVQTLKEQANSTKPILQVQLTAFKGKNFSPDRIRLYTTETEIDQNTVDLQINVTFSKGFNENIGFVLYDNDQFFQSKSFQPSLDTKRRVISANLEENPEIVQFTVSPSADLTMSLNDFACVFWSYSEKDWITDGCSKTVNSSGSTGCSCKNKQKANFAILMAYDINYNYSKALDWISITGCFLSVLGLCATALYQIRTRKSRGGNPTLLVVNICLSMTVFYLFFIFGINNPVEHPIEREVSGENIVPESDHHKYPDQGPCTAFTALLQYFLLATFTWNTLYGINVYINETPRWFPKAFIAVGWGLPAVIVGISLGSTYRVDEPLGYRQEEFCWLASVDHKQTFSIKKPMFWGFILPLLIMLILNTAILLHFMYNICKTNPNLNTSPLKKKIWSSFSVAVMLSLSWFTGYFILVTPEKETLNLILSVVFCLLNATQGFQIFILFALGPFLISNPAVLKSLCAPEVGLHKKSFYLWKKKKQKSKESYISTDDCQDKPV